MKYEFGGMVIDELCLRFVDGLECAFALTEVGVAAADGTVASVIGCAVEEFVTDCTLEFGHMVRLWF